MGTAPGPKNIVLVHGAFVDGSTWRGVYEELVADGYPVAVVQNPTLSLHDDADVVRRAINASWPTHRCRGASTPWLSRSTCPHGSINQAGICSHPRTA